MDLSDGSVDDGSAARWLIGEGAAAGIQRPMKDPTIYQDPDSTCSSYYFVGTADAGGVHINSGIINKLVYLLVDGGTHNELTVSAMGIPLVADLLYECQTNLLVPGSDFTDFYNAMTQAAINLGLDATQRENIDQAMRSVHLHPDVNCQATPAPPVNDEWGDAVAITYGQITGYTEAGSLSNAPTCASPIDLSALSGLVTLDFRYHLQTDGGRSETS